MSSYTQPRTIPRICEKCGQHFLAQAYAVNHGRARFCSIRCCNESRRVRPKADGTQPTCACGCGQRVVSTTRNGWCLFRAGHQFKAHKQLRELHPGWKGGKTFSGGRVILLRPDHHRAHSDGYVLRSVLVMEEVLGRPITRAEQVHHINHDTLDDRPENLQVLSPREHSRAHTQRRTPNGRYARINV